MSTSTGTETPSNGSSGLAGRLKEDGKARLESGKRSAADQIEQVADAIDAAGAQLDRDQPTISSYASRLATGVGNLAHRLRDSSVEEIGRDLRGMAARNPGMFLLGGVALGIVLSRVARASGGVTQTTARAESPVEDDDASDTDADAPSSTTGATQ